MQKVNESDICMPINGDIEPLSKAQDPMFQEEMLGLTICIKPSESTIYAPFDGIVSLLYPSNHAIGIIRDDGLEILIHVGVDTVRLNGKGFHARVKQGDRVERNMPLLEFDKNAIQAQGYSIQTFIVFTNDKQFKINKLYTKEKVKVKDVLCHANKL